MKNEEFSDLTQFFDDEYSKISQVFGVRELPSRDIRVMTKAISKKFALYSALDKRKDKLRIKIDYAKFTMPHGFIWKLFHRKLWLYVKKELEEENQTSKKDISSEVLPEVATKQVDLNALTVLPDKKDFM